MSDPDPVPHTISRRALLAAAVSGAALAGLGTSGVTAILSSRPGTIEIDGHSLTLDDARAVQQLGYAVLEIEPAITDRLTELPTNDDPQAWIRNVHAAIIDDAERARMIQVDGWLLPRAFAALAAAAVR